MVKIIKNISNTQISTRKFSLQPTLTKKVEATVDDISLSSFGGIAILRKIEQKLGLSRQLADCIKDKRSPSKVSHTLTQLLMTRIMLCALGYEDCNDCDHFRDDPMMRLAVCDSLGLESPPSQPTMTRFENMVSDDDLDRLEDKMLSMYIDSFPSPPKRIIVDFDDTDADVYGNQELSVFNGYYGEFCYMPLLVFDGDSGKFITARLNPGRTNKQIDVFDLYKKIVLRLRKAWPDTLIVIRGDSHFCSHEFMDWVSEGNDLKIRYITGLSNNNALKNHPEVLRLQALAEEHFNKTGVPKQFFGELRYKASTWRHEQRVIVKAEVTKREGLNTRFVVTNFKLRTDIFGLPYSAPMYLYQKWYCARGNDELYIGQFKNAVHGDRMSCQRYKANRLRLFIYAAAYILLHAMRHGVLRGTRLENATLLNIREKFLLCAVVVDVKKTKIRLRFGRAHPMADIMEHALAKCAA